MFWSFFDYQQLPCGGDSQDLNVGQTIATFLVFSFHFLSQIVTSCLPSPGCVTARVLFWTAVSSSLPSASWDRWRFLRRLASSSIELRLLAACQMSMQSTMIVRALLMRWKFFYIADHSDSLKVLKAQCYRRMIPSEVKKFERTFVENHFLALTNCFLFFFSLLLTCITYGRGECVKKILAWKSFMINLQRRDRWRGLARVLVPGKVVKKFANHGKLIFMFCSYLPPRGPWSFAVWRDRSLNT